MPDLVMHDTYFVWSWPLNALLVLVNRRQDHPCRPGGRIGWQQRREDAGVGNGRLGVAQLCHDANRKEISASCRVHPLTQVASQLARARRATVALPDRADRP